MRLAIGFSLFIAITAIHVLTIAKGATRIAEVSVRFTLDSLPGRQMTIEADYSSGAIDQKEAALRKEQLHRELDFYDALDGVRKFIFGNVKTGIIITVIIIVGGIIIGMLFREESLNDALVTYISLAIGSGILSMFPASMVSVAIGIVVTREVSVR